MDGNRFDDLTRRLETVRSRRTLTQLLSAGALLAPLAAWGRGDTGAKGKGKGKKARKKPVCLCSESGCTSQKVKKPSKLITQNPRCNYAGSCTTNPCATPTAPPAGCTPSCAQKVCGDNGCGGSCGTCGASEVCGNGRCASSCPEGQRSCAGECILNASQCCTDADCPAFEACVNSTCACEPTFGACGTGQFCNLDTLRCEACRGPGGSCSIGGGGFGSEACCSSECKGTCV